MVEEIRDELKELEVKASLKSDSMDKFWRKWNDMKERVDPPEIGWGYQ